MRVAARITRFAAAGRGKPWSGGRSRPWPPNQLMPISSSWPSGRAVVDRRTIHIRDMAVAVRREYKEVADRQRSVGLRTVLTTPLLLKGKPVGGIAIRRTKVRPFSAN